MSEFNSREWLDAFAGAVDLTLRETRVLLAMSRYASWETGRGCRPSVKTIAEWTGIGIRRLKGADGAVESLVRKGWLVRVADAAQHRPAEYRLSIGQARPRPEVAGSATSDRTPEVAGSATSESAGATPGVAEPATPGDCTEVAGLAPRGGRFGTPEVAGLARQRWPVRPPERSLNGYRTDLGTEGVRASAPATPATLPIPDSPDDEAADVIDAEVIDEPPAAPAAPAVIPDPASVIIQAKELAEYAARQLRSHGSLKAICSRKTPNAFAELLNLGARNEQIRFAIDYAIVHRYWSGRVTTPEDITRNYDRIVADIRADMIQRNTPTRGESIADKNARLLAAAAAADRQETPA